MILIIGTYILFLKVPSGRKFYYYYWGLATKRANKKFMTDGWCWSPFPSSSIKGSQRLAQQFNQKHVINGDCPDRMTSILGHFSSAYIIRFLLPNNRHESIPGNIYQNRCATLHWIIIKETILNRKKALVEIKLKWAWNRLCFMSAFI